MNHGMKTISVREMKAKWSEVEAEVKAGEEFEVLNRGKPSVRIVAAGPRKVIEWDDHLATAIKCGGPTAEEIVRWDRDRGY